MGTREQGHWIGPLMLALVVGAGVWIGGDVLLGSHGSLGGGEAIAQGFSTEGKQGSSCKVSCEGCFTKPRTQPKRCCKKCKRPSKPKPPAEPTPEEVAAMCACLDKHEYPAAACDLRGSQFPPYHSSTDGQAYPCPETKRKRQREAFCHCVYRYNPLETCREHLGKGKKTKKRRERATSYSMCFRGGARF